MARVKSGSGRWWMQEHRVDPYVGRAAREGYRARSVYKLIEIDKKDDLLRSGMRILDLGAAPGAWCQYLARRVGSQGTVIALDILEMEPIANVTFVRGDFRDDLIVDKLRLAIGDELLDLVVSDMSPNMAGIRAADQARAMHLAELTLDVCPVVLSKGGSLLTKVFQGEGIEGYRASLKNQFGKLVTRKPKASRGRSREHYLLARGFLGAQI